MSYTTKSRIGKEIEKIQKYVNYTAVTDFYLQGMSNVKFKAHSPTGMQSFKWLRKRKKEVKQDNKGWLIYF